MYVCKCSGGTLWGSFTGADLLSKLCGRMEGSDEVSLTTNLEKRSVVLTGRN